MREEDRASYEKVEAEFAALSNQVDPDDPWSHSEAERLDAISVGDWLRSAGATPDVVRARDLAMAALGAESVERTSLLADLRKEATVGSPGFYSYDHCEAERVAEGSATVALMMADELGHRIRYDTVVSAIDVGSAGCSVLCGATVTLWRRRRYSPTPTPSGRHRARTAPPMRKPACWEEPGLSGKASFPPSSRRSAWRRCLPDRPSSSNRN